MPDTADHFLLICSTCQGNQSSVGLRDMLSGRLPDDFQLKLVDCMAGCGRPTTVGFQAVDKAQYLFGDIRSAADVEAVITFAQQYRQSEDGWTKATERPRQLINKTLSRLPRLETRALP